MPLQFQVKIFAKNRFKPLNRLIGIVKMSCHDVLWNFATQTGRRNNQSFMIFFEQFLIDPWFVVKTFGIGSRYQFEEVSVTNQIFGQ